MSEKYSENTTELTPAQIKALRLIKEISLIIIDQFPQIGEAYRGGMDQGSIVKEFGLEQFAPNFNIARSAVQLALKTLIPDHKERQILAEQMMMVNGLNCVKEGVGIHGLDEETRKQIGRKSAAVLEEKELGIYTLTLEERSAQAIKNMKAGVGVTAQTTEQLREIGLKAFAEKKGVHAQTTEQLREIGKRNYEKGLGIHGQTKTERKNVTRKATLKRGKIPWENFFYDLETGLDEHFYCLMLIQSDEYRYVKCKKICLKYKLIAEKLNAVFHNGARIRTKSSIKNFLYQRVSKENRAFIGLG